MSHHLCPVPPPLGLCPCVAGISKTTGCEHLKIHVVSITQQLLIIGDQDGTSRLGEGGKLAIIWVGDKGEAFGMGRSSEADQPEERVPLRGVLAVGRFLYKHFVGYN